MLQALLPRHSSVPQGYSGLWSPALPMPGECVGLTLRADAASPSVLRGGRKGREAPSSYPPHAPSGPCPRRSDTHSSLPSSLSLSLLPRRQPSERPAQPGASVRPGPAPPGAHLHRRSRTAAMSLRGAVARAVRSGCVIAARRARGTLGVVVPGPQGGRRRWPRACLRNRIHGSCHGKGFNESSPRSNRTAH